MSLCKKAMGDDTQCDFIKNSFIKWRGNAYIEKVRLGCATTLFDIYCTLSPVKLKSVLFMMVVLCLTEYV